MKIYKHSHFLADENGHGGNKRTAQINQILHDAGIEFEETDFNMSSKSKNKVQLYLKGLFHNKKFSRQQKHHYATGRFLDLFESFIKRNRPDLFIWESTVGYYLLLSDILKKYQIPTIALPHNLESLVTGSQNIFNLKPSPIWLNEEIGHLRNCNCIFTMSREESWLLSAFGLNSICLPYYPPRNTEASLKAIREK